MAFTPSAAAPVRSTRRERGRLLRESPDELRARAVANFVPPIRRAILPPTHVEPFRNVIG